MFSVVVMVMVAIVMIIVMIATAVPKRLHRAAIFELVMAAVVVRVIVFETALAVAAIAGSPAKLETTCLSMLGTKDGAREQDGRNQKCLGSSNLIFLVIKERVFDWGRRVVQPRCLLLRTFRRVLQPADKKMWRLQFVAKFKPFYLDSSTGPCGSDPFKLLLN